MSSAAGIATDSEGGGPRRVAIVTGAAEGIGRGIATRLARDGFDVGVFDLPRARERLEGLAGELRAAHGVRVVCVYGDVAKEEDVRELVESVVRELGGLWAMVANAGVAVLRVLHETPTEELERLLDINVKGTFFSYKYAAIELIKQGKGGRIIGAASIASKRGFPEHAAYCATKFAVRGMTQCAAIDYGPHGITVNAYAPGAVETGLLDGLDEYRTSVGGQPRGTWSESLNKLGVLGRKGQPEDVAKLVSFLVSDEASFITGQSVSRFLRQRGRRRLKLAKYLVDGGSTFD